MCYRHDVVNKQIIGRFIQLWQCKQFALFVRPINDRDERDIDDIPTGNDQQQKTDSIDTNYMFGMILSPAYIIAQQSKARASFEWLAQIITKLIEKHFMTINFLNQQVTKLLRMTWDQVSGSDQQALFFFFRIGT